MIGLKIIFISTLMLFSYSEARRLKFESVCPDCGWELNITYPEFAMKHLSGVIPSPEDGVCTQGSKWIVHGADFGFKINACCCLILLTEQIPIDCSTVDAVQGPDVPMIGYSETFGIWLLRLGTTLEYTPSNCCCPEGKFSRIYPAAYTGASHDICACVTPNNLVILPSSSSSSSGEGG